jgi:putative membrane-bound dehydrogenase-like protein
MAEGDAFQGQPIQGDAVQQRRSDMRSNHQGNFWVGTFERLGDNARGVLTSVSFTVTHPWASFQVAGGAWPTTRVELIDVTTQNPIIQASGTDSETLRPVVVDLRKHQGRKIFIRVVDQQVGHWGHINFDAFAFHPERPEFPDELTLAEIQQKAPPPPDQVLFGGLSPQAAAEAATLPPGFKLHVFAAEPDVVQPIAFALDDRGRVWVAEGKCYPKKRREGEGIDRILVFEDTTGDHQFDRRTVFMDGLNLISGLEVGFGGVWVGAAPHLLFIPVKDWDNPQPSGDPVVLLDGWDYERDTHETLNTFVWGPDGWLYGCHGVFCPSHVGKPGAPESERQWVDAAVWRYHPVQHELEIFTEGGSNPWGIDFDEKGELWAEMCVIPHLFHMIQGARIQRQGGEHYAVGRDEIARNEAHRDARSRKPIFPYVYEDMKTHADHVHYAGNQGPHAGNNRSDAAGGGHAHAGLLCYLGTSWPDSYRGKLLMGNIHGQRLNVDIPVPEGSGYVGVHAPDFLNFNDSWSQTLNQLIDPDGSMYIIDWYDKNQCHHNNIDGHDRGNGRIFKVVYNNQPKTQVDLLALSDVALAELVPSRNEWMSRHARRVLQERAAIQALDPAARQILRRVMLQGASPEARLRGLWASHITGSLQMSDTEVLLRDPDPSVRGWTLQIFGEGAIRIPEEQWDSEEAQAALATLTSMAREDDSPVVRRYLASLLQRIPAAHRWETLTALAQHEEDQHDHNLPLLYWYATEGSVATEPDQALAFLKAGQIPKVREFTARRLTTLGLGDSRSGILDRLTAVLAGVEEERAALDILRGIQGALQGRRQVTMPAGWEIVETRFSGSERADLRSLTQALSLTFGSQRALEDLRRISRNASAPTTERTAALTSLLAARDQELPTVLQDLLQDPAVRSQALRGLAAYDHLDTPNAILKVYPVLSAGERRDALSTLASRPGFAKSLLRAVGDGRVERTAITAEIVRQLRSLKDESIQQMLTQVYGVIQETSPDMEKEVDRYKKLYWAGGSQPGNASRGRVVYNQICGQCHHLFDSGGQVGPDITGANRGDLDYLLQNILFPNAVIPNEYLQSFVETHDGRILTGIVKSRDDTAVVIQTANELITVPRSEVDRMEQSEISMMPEGLLGELKDQEIRDLLYYLSRPGQVPLPQAEE